MKPRLLMATLLVLILAVPASMLAQQNSEAEKEIRAVLAQSEQANLKGGAEAAATFDKIIGDDYTRIPPNGAALTKADIVNGFKTGKIKVQSLKNSDIKIHIYGHTAIATGVSTRSENFLGAALTGSSRWTRVLVKRSGVWQIVLFQNTNIAQPANAQALNYAPPSYVADPVAYTLIKENDQFRIIIAKKPAGHRDAWHSHLANTVYDLTDCQHRIYAPDGTTMENTAKAGSVFLQPAILSHSTENIGTAECDQLIVERK